MKFLNLATILVWAGFACGCSAISGELKAPIVWETDVPPSITLQIRDWVTYEIPILERYLNVSYHENQYREQELGLSRPKDTSFPLSENQRDRILLLLDSAVTNMPLRDKTVAPDGTIWKLESRIYQEVTFSVWTPTYKMEERGYTHLIALENYLNQLANNSNAHNK